MYACRFNIFRITGKLSKIISNNDTQSFSFKNGCLRLCRNASSNNESVHFASMKSLHFCVKRHSPISFIRTFCSTGCLAKEKASDDDLYNLESGYEYEDEDGDQALENAEHQEFAARAFRIPGTGHNVFVVQPKVKTWQKKNHNTTPELQLAEAVTLAETLPGWKVVDKIILGSPNSDKKFVFGTGNFAKLKGLIKEKSAVTAIFFGIDILSGLQHTELEKEFGLPVYDRYSIVLQIFFDHARSKEAKLQVALAEIPYLRTRLRHLHETSRTRERGDMMHIGGSGETFFQTRRRLLFEREVKLKKMLDKIRKQRNILRQNRIRNEFPVVAVVGYTNAGKTSLIKILTNDDKMQPKDQLFATLDVTAHATSLPGFQKIIYMDTVGFISDIPTTLIKSFSATLEDIAHSDLIIHVCDLSHPDAFAQKESVLKTLESLSLSPKLMDTMVEVGNKIDLLEKRPETEETILISATKGTGIAELRLEIEEKIMENTGQLYTTLRVPNGGEASSWLYKMAGLRSMQPDPDDFNFLLVDVVLTPSLLSIFKHHFGDLELKIQTPLECNL